MSTTQYEEQAETFLKTYGLRFVATAALVNRQPPWADTAERHGKEWTISLSGKTETGLRRITFPFWNSINAGAEEPSAYDVLACISSDVTCPQTFKEFCSEYGYEEDSHKAEATFKRCKRLSDKLQAFFTAQEIEALQEIQ